MIQTKENDKNLTLGMIQTYWAKIRAFTFFKKKYLDLSVTRYGQLSSFKISEKTKDPISRKFCDGKRDGWTDRETERRK